MWDWATVMAGLGGLALVSQLVQFVWQRGDRAEKQMAASIRASEIVRDAVGDVAIAAVDKSGTFATAAQHGHLVTEVGEVKGMVRSGNAKLDQLLLMAARARLNIRGGSDEET
jgi:hypothetical protein